MGVGKPSRSSPGQGSPTGSITEMCPGEVGVAQTDQDRLAGSPGAQPRSSPQPGRGGAVMSHTERGPQGSRGPSPSLVQCNNGVFLCPGHGVGVVTAPKHGMQDAPSLSCTALLGSVCLLTEGVN